MAIERSLGSIMRTCYDLAVVNWNAKHNLGELISVAEKIYHNQIKSIVGNVIAEGKQIILLAGPSSAGKTTSSKKLKEELERHGITGQTISLDDFFLERDRTPRLPNGNYDYENITALDLEHLARFVDDITEKGKGSLPHYDFKTGTRDRVDDFIMGEGDVLVIEGNHALNPALQLGHADSMYKVYVTPNANFELGRQVVLQARKLRLMRRIHRDMQTRGRSIHETIKGWDEVARGEDIYICPYKSCADFLLDTAHMYEPLLWDSCLTKLLLPLKGIAYVDEMLDVFDKIGTVKKSAIPDESLLWEFLVK